MTRTDSADDRRTDDKPLSRHLYAALDADDADERGFHVRQAAQLFAAARAETGGDDA